MPLASLMSWRKYEYCINSESEKIDTILFEGYQKEEEESSYRCSCVYLVGIEFTPGWTFSRWLLIKLLVSFQPLEEGWRKESLQFGVGQDPSIGELPLPK
jgi:hypothetical protein